MDRLRLTKGAADQKAKQVLALIVSNKFRHGFNDMQSAVDALRSLQTSARNWHENHWEKSRSCTSRSMIAVAPSMPVWTRS